MSVKPNMRMVFADICETIVGQQLSGKAAKTIFTRFQALCGKISAKRVVALNLEELRSVGISYAKGRALHDLADRIESGLLNLKDIDRIEDEELRHRLIAVRGIGPWTSEIILMFTLHRADVFSAGDLGLQKGVQLVYNLKSLPSHAYVTRVSLGWSPYRTYAALLLWRLVDSKKEQKSVRRSAVQ
jgi:DNA-3-methyladenine glycosylase II